MHVTIPPQVEFRSSTRRNILKTKQKNGSSMKNFNRINRGVLLSLLSTSSLLLTGVAFAAEPGGIVETAQQKAYEITGKDVAILKFNRGSSALSSSDQSELRTMYNAVKSDALVKEIVIAAYSDLPYPKSKKSDLPQKSRGLAEKRGEQVTNFLHELGAKNVRVVNMAQKATWIERSFDTDAAQIKRGAGEQSDKVDADDKFYESLGKHLQTTGGPGEVVVVIRHD